jgi:hypothetical protein
MVHCLGCRSFSIFGYILPGVWKYSSWVGMENALLAIATECVEPGQGRLTRDRETPFNKYEPDPTLRPDLCVNLLESKAKFTVFS